LGLRQCAELSTLALHYIVAHFPWSLPPVIERELRVAARRNATYWNRVGAGAAGGVLFWIVMTARLATGRVADAGRMTFGAMSALAALIVATGVLGEAARAFVREKREETLGFLLLTPLKPAELAAGKLLSATLSGFYRFVAIIPVLALPMLFGGVSLGQFLMLVVALANLGWFAAALGLNVSVQAWDEKSAGSRASIRMAGISVVLPLVLSLVLRSSGLPKALVLCCSPLSAVWVAASPSATAYPTYLCSLLATQAVAWWFFRQTCQLLPNCWKERSGKPVPMLLTPPAVVDETWRPREPKPAGRVQQKQTLLQSRKLVRRQFDAGVRKRLLDHNPVLWLAQRWRADNSSAWILGSLGLVGASAAVITLDWNVLVHPIFVLWATYCVCAALKLHVATQAGLALARDRTEDTLELLLSTPLSATELAQGHLEAVLTPTRRWALRVMASAAAWMLLACAVAFWRAEPPWTPLGLFAVLLILLLPDLRAVAWDALWLGVVEKNSRVATHNTLVRILALPWLAVIAVGIVGGFTFNIRVVPTICIITLLASSLLTDWWFAKRAQERVRAQLVRRAAWRAGGEEEQYERWQGVGRWLGRRWRRLTS